MRFAATIALSLLLAGCVTSAPPVPRDHYYRVLVSAPVAMTAQPLFQGTVVVGRLEADGLLRERPLLFSASGRPHEVQQHDYHYWADPPPRMLQGQLVDYLRAARLADAVVTPEMRIPARYEIVGEIRRMERLLAGGPPRVIVELELGMVDIAANRLVAIDTYAAEVPADSNAAQDAAGAVNAALARIFARFAADLGKAGSKLPTEAVLK